MHHRLEDYLSQVAAELSEVPGEQREEDLREMRQHLTNAVTVNQEIMRQDEDLAVESALQEFGAPKELAAEMLTAWRRGEAKENRRSLAGAMLCSAVSLTAGFGILHAVYRPSFTSGYTLSQQLLVDVIALSWSLTIWTITSVLNGILFPRRALTATRIAILASYAMVACRILATHSQHILTALCCITVYMGATEIWTRWWIKLAILWRKRRMQPRATR
jgi:uncharacterized membrane protein